MRWLQYCDSRKHSRFRPCFLTIPPNCGGFASELRRKFSQDSGLIEKLRMRSVILRRARFGRSSEKLDPLRMSHWSFAGRIERATPSEQARTEVSDGEGFYHPPSKGPSVPHASPNHLLLETSCTKRPAFFPTCGAERVRPYRADGATSLDMCPSHSKRCAAMCARR